LYFWVSIVILIVFIILFTISWYLAQRHIDINFKN